MINTHGLVVSSILVEVWTLYLKDGKLFERVPKMAGKVNKPIDRLKTF